MSAKRLFSMALILVGNVVYAFAIKLFLLPMDLISSGTTGIALVVNHMLGIPVSVFIFCFNAVMLALGWWVLGRKFAMTTVFSSLFYPVALEVLNRLLGDVRLTENMLLNVLFAGMGLGLGIGLVMRGGASTGGIDIPALILKRKLRIPVSATLWVCDFFIIMLQMTYHPAEDLLYGILLILGVSMTLNKVLLMGTSRTEVKIVSSRAEEIRQAILSRVDRGVTMLHGEGGYLREQTEIIFSVISNHELPRLEQAAREIDPNCFMVISQVTEVWGRGFTASKHPGGKNE